MAIKTIKEYKVNPSIELVGYLLTETKETLRTRDRRIGKVNGKIEVIFNTDRVLKYKDTSKFIKVYVDSNMFREYNLLSSTAQRLLTSIMEKLEYNQDSFYYSPSSLSKDADIDERNVSIYMKELLDKEWIFKSDDKRRYWINLCYFCIGDREEIYRKVKATTR